MQMLLPVGKKQAIAVEAPTRSEVSRFRYQLASWLVGDDRARLERALLAPLAPLRRAAISSLSKAGRARLTAATEYRKPGDYKVRIFYVNQADEIVCCESASLSHATAHKMAGDIKGAHRVEVWKADNVVTTARLVIFPSQVYTIAAEERQAA